MYIVYVCVYVVGYIFLSLLHIKNALSFVNFYHIRLDNSGPIYHEGRSLLESAICFSNLQISKKKFQKTILNLKFKFPAYNTLLLLAGNLNFKFRIVFWNISFLEIWRFEKRIALSEKKPPLQCDGGNLSF